MAEEKSILNTAGSHKFVSTKRLRILGAAIFLFFLPLIIHDEYYLHLFQTMAYTYIVILGLDVLVGYTGNFSFGHAGFYAIGAYTTALLTTKLGWSFWLALPFAPLLSGLAGIGMAIPSMRPKGPFLIMVTAAFGLIIYIVTNQWVSLTGGPSGILHIPVPTVFGHEFNGTHYFYLCSGLALLMHIGAQNLLRARWGRTFFSLQMSEIAAESLGVYVYWWKIKAFVISAAYAGVAGSLFAHQNHYINSDSFNIYTSIFFVLAVIFGGMGTRYGPLVGTIILSVLPQIFAPIYNYYFLVYGAILLCCVVLLPRGIVGTIQNWVRRRTKVTKLEISEFSGPDDEKIATSTPASLQTNNLTINFGGLRAIDDLSIRIEPGTIHGLIGPNGSGKTTLINLISDIYRPDEGEIIYQGQDITSASSHEIAAKGIARTFQTSQLFDHISVLENVMLGFHTRMKSNFVQHYLWTRKARFDEEKHLYKSLDMLNFVGIQDKAYEDAGNLSHGHKRFLEVGRALALKPKLILLDEPAGGLSSEEIQELLNIILDLRRSGISVLLVEHRMELVMEICDRITVLNFGKKIAEGTPEEIQNDEEVIKAYLG